MAAQNEPEADAIERTSQPAGKLLASTTTRSWLARGSLILAGLALGLGFFLPWLRLAGLASISGFGLMVTDGQAVEMISGPHRLLLFAVPLFGVARVIGGITGHRIAAWLALAAGVIVVGDGLVTLVMLFLNTTGIGMWLVIGGSLMALVTGLLTVGPRR